MSIEKLLETHTAAVMDNTAAVRELTAAWLALTVKANQIQPAQEITAAGVKLAGAVALDGACKPAKVVEEKKSVSGVEPAVTDSTSTTEDAIPPSGSLEYSTVRDLLLSLAKTRRDDVKAVLRSHGMSRLDAVLSDVNDFSTVTDALKLAAVYADLLKVGV